jgi:hypothetical protein
MPLARRKAIGSKGSMELAKAASSSRARRAGLASASIKDALRSRRSAPQFLSRGEPGSTCLGARKVRIESGGRGLDEPNRIDGTGEGSCAGTA